MRVTRFFMEGDDHAMFAIGETVIYGHHGVCEITGIQDMEIMDAKRSYYVLRSVFDSSSTYYLPFGDEKVSDKIRKILSVEEIEALIKQMPEEDTIWIENAHERRTLYKQIVVKNDSSEVIRLIRTLHLRQEHLKETGKKLHVADERFFKDAEEALYQEFAFVLDLKPEEVLPFIFQKLDTNNAV